LQKENIIYNYRYENEESNGDYQLVLRGNIEHPTNDLLFFKLYELLITVFKTNDDAYPQFHLSPVLEYHYQTCKYSKFEFVTIFAAAYRQEKKQKALLPLIKEVIYFIDSWLNLHEKNSVIYEGTIRVSAIADETVAADGRIPLGTPYTLIPEPTTVQEAFQRLKFLTAQQVCEYYIEEFERHHPDATSEVYFSEIASLDKFINSVSMMKWRTLLKERIAIFSMSI